MLSRSGAKVIRLTQMSGTCKASVFQRWIAWQVVSQPRWKWQKLPVSIVLCVACLSRGTPASAQAPPQQTLTVIDAIELAQKNYAPLTEIRARSQAAKESVAVARTAYIP